jgi:hypothetical protein
MKIVDFNEGCAVELATNNSYGPAFNRIGGGWYVAASSLIRGLHLLP